MQNVRWFLFVAVAGPTIAACGGDDSYGDMLDASGGGGPGGISTDSGAGAGGRAGSAGSGGSAGAPKDATNGSDGGGSNDSGAGGSSGSAGMDGGGGTAGANIDAASDTTTVRDAPPEGGGRPDSGSGGDAPSPDGGAACSSGPAMGMTCTHYCSAWFSTCQPIATWSTTYASPAACMAACSQWNDTKLCCRAEHVHNATVAPNPNQAEKLCGQAVGVSAPDACL